MSGKYESHISPKEAVELAKNEYSYKVTTETIRNWCEKFDIGEKVVGKWFIDPDLLRSLLEGE